MSVTPYTEFMSIVATQVYFGLENAQHLLQILLQRGVVLITVPLLRTSDITQWCDCTFFLTLYLDA